MTTRLAVLVSHPIPYFVPLYRRLADAFELKVFYCSTEGLESAFNAELGVSYEWDIDLLGGYRSEFLAPIGDTRLDHFTGLVNPSVIARLNRRDLDLVLVHGWATATMILGVIAATARRLPFLFTGDSADIYRTPLLRRAAKQLVLRPMFHMSAGALYSGTFNRDFYVRYGMPADRLFFGPWSVDNDRYRPSPDPTAAAAERVRVRTEIGEPLEGLLVLFSGKLVARKRPLDLVRAAALARSQSGADIRLVFAGDGPLRSEIETMAVTLGVPANVLGFFPQSRMPPLYRASDLLCLPSERDPRGTVANEAMAAGLPVVVATGVGIWGEGDILRDGQNGFVVDIGDADALANRLARLADPVTRRAASEASIRIISEWSHETYVDGVRLAAERILQR